MSNLCQSLSHSKWNCKYHVVFIPEKRRKALFPNIRKNLGATFHELARQKECEIPEGGNMSDHVHMRISIPPKHPVASIIGFIKGKSAIAIARTFLGKERNYNGANFWARGYAVSTAGFELDRILKYIKEQEENDNDASAPVPVKAN